VSEEPIDVRLTTINGDDYNNGCIMLGGGRTAGGITMLYDIGIDGEEYAPIEETPDGDLYTPGDEMDYVDRKIDKLVDEKHRLQRFWPGNHAARQKRVVTLLPGEGLSRSLVLQDQPWYDEVVAILEGSGLTKYRIQPRADVYVVEPDGFTKEDTGTSRAYGCHYCPGDDAIKTKAAAVQPDAAPVQPGDNPPAGKTGD
jgi:hypothetical protein